MEQRKATMIKRGLIACIGIGCAASFQLHIKLPPRASSGRHNELASVRTAVTHRRPRHCAHRFKAATDEGDPEGNGDGDGDGDVQTDEADGRDDGWMVNIYGERVRREPDPRQR